MGRGVCEEDEEKLVRNWILTASNHAGYIYIYVSRRKLRRRMRQKEEG